MADSLGSLQTLIGDRYRLERELGRGGMATVYAAFDHRHARRVALKVLHPHAAQALGGDRFLREITIAAQLQHPGIVALFDSSQTADCPYYVMPLVEGESLRERLTREGRFDIPTAARIAREVGEALAYAHRKGVVHRDIKPANILLADGRAMVADFGIGRVLDSAGGERLTQTGLALGTPTYMSPEQAAGARDVDGRSDLYSLGCVFYEMLVGVPPFVGPTAQATLVKRITDAAPSLRETRPEAPSGLQQVVTKALATNPDDRYSTAEAFLADLAVAMEAPADASVAERERDVAGRPLGRPAEGQSKPRFLSARRWLVGSALAVLVAVALAYASQRGGSGTARITSLAVLPLANLSGDPTEDYFADGMTDALIGTLAQIRALTRVVSRTSVMRYKGSDLSLPEIARELNVDAVIEGSVQRSGGRVKVKASLISAATDSPMWSRDFDRDLSDVLKLQSDIAGAVAREIRITVTAEESARLAAARNIDPQAHEAYLLGNYHLRTNEDDLRRAVGHFERATQLAPEYAEAFAGLSSAWMLRGIWGAKSRTDVAPFAQAAAVKAVRLDSLLPEAHIALASVKLYEFDWTGAERELARALDLDPNNAVAYQQKADLLMALERHDEAIKAIERAGQLDPFSSYIESRHARVLYRARRYNEALPHVQRAIDLDPNPGNSMPHWIRGELFIEMGQYDEALASLEKARESGGNALLLAPTTAHVYARMGKRSEARRMLAALKAKSDSASFASAPVAHAYAALGDKDRAFAVLFRLVSERSNLATHIKADPPLELLHSDPRWRELLRRMNLEAPDLGGSDRHDP